MHEEWKNNKCQPNFYINVKGQSEHCPPYSPIDNKVLSHQLANKHVTKENHDTIGMIVVDKNHDIACILLLL